jgi:two-component system cell cycle response regulator DivK
MNQTILTVDDNPMNLKLIKLLLAKEGFTVRTAEGAQDALEVLQSFTPDAVLMDIAMPGINGLQLIRLLKLNQRTRGIPILAVSAHALRDNIQEAYTAGCDGYITKPIDTRTFGSVIQDCLSAALGRQRKPRREESALFPARWDYRGRQRKRIGPAAALRGVARPAQSSEADEFASSLRSVKAGLTQRPRPA